MRFATRLGGGGGLGLQAAVAVQLSLLLSVLSSGGSSVLVSADSGSVWATPHDSFSSSVGVLGCKIDTDRVAYWPDSVDCTNICVQLSYGGRSVKLLRIDQSQGAHDVSYDAWNYLYTGYSATEQPTAGGAVAMDYEDLDASDCTTLLKGNGGDGRVPLSAANSMNFLASCLDANTTTYVAENYALYNILDSVCTWGYDEECTLEDWPNANQPTCPHTLGTPVALTVSDPVINIEYPSGERVEAGTGTVVNSTDSESSGSLGLATTGSNSFGHRGPIPGPGWVLAFIVAASLACNGVQCLQ